MPLLTTEASKMETPQLHRALVMATIAREPLFHVLPFKSLKGSQYEFNRTNTEPAGKFAGENASTVQGNLTLTKVTENVTTLYEAADVSKLAQALGTNQPKARLNMMIIRGIINTFKDTIITGDGTSDTFKGIRERAIDESLDDVKTSATDGEVITLDHLRAIKDAMKEGIDAYVCSFRTLRSIHAIYDALGGTVPQAVIQGYGPVTAFDGTPILPSDHVSIAETQGVTTTCARVHGVRLDEDFGFTALMAQGPELPDGSMTIPLGLNLSEMELEGKIHDRIRAYWFVGSANHSPFSCASVLGITN